MTLKPCISKALGCPGFPYINFERSVCLIIVQKAGTPGTWIHPILANFENLKKLKMSKVPQLLFEQSNMNDQVLKLLLRHSKCHNAKISVYSTKNTRDIACKTMKLFSQFSYKIINFRHFDYHRCRHFLGLNFFWLLNWSKRRGMQKNSTSHLYWFLFYHMLYIVKPTENWGFVTIQCISYK
jgi:hypothetical protein